MAMSEWLIEATGLHTYYGASHILHGVDFRVARGEAIGLMGRNGMGKTTLIKSLLGLVPVQSGQIQIAGQSMRGAPPYRIARAGIGYVPEGRGIFPTLSVIENLQMAARPGIDGRRHWTLERVLLTFPRLAERRHHGGTQLSGGEQQMLSIGRALMTHPDILFLDEATEGLAPLIREDIWRCLDTLRAQGQSVLVIDKYVQRLIALAGHHTIMERGRAVWSGDSDTLAAQPELWRRYVGI
jgi:branched-chain amino acid transport system ATP-binding protein